MNQPVNPIFTRTDQPVSPMEDEEKLEELMEQATQEFRSYLKNQVNNFF